MATLAVIVATLSFAVSSVTARLTLLRRGTVKMTQPTQVFLGPADSRRRGEAPLPKVYLRTLLFATSKRGRVIENMYVALVRGDTVHQHFNIWVYGERHELVRGSGLFVGEDGISANHHFLSGPDRADFSFTEGSYRLEVFVRLLGDRRDKQLFAQDLVISRDIAAALCDPAAGVYFDWAPDTAQYVPFVDRNDGFADRPPPIR